MKRIRFQLIWGVAYGMGAVTVIANTLANEGVLPYWPTFTAVLALVLVANVAASVFADRP